jgi:predicted acetyltransferase
MRIQQWVYETPEALQGLTAYLRSQADQVRRVVFYTFDESFFYALTDPRNGSDHLLPPVNHESNAQGVGLMYRIINLRRFFELLAEHDFGGETLTLGLNVRDTFVPEENGALTVRFEGGRARVVDGDVTPDVTVDIGVAELSSLLMGCVPFGALYDLGLAHISDVARVEQVERLFRAPRKPICLTPF